MFVKSSEQLAEKKLLLLYIFKQFETWIPHTQITSFVLENDLMNYFMFQQFLGELKKSGFVVEETQEKEPAYQITEKGMTTLDYFINRLGEPQRHKIDQLLGTTKEALVRSKEVLAEYAQVDVNRVLVTLKIMERGTPLIQINLNAGDTKQAKNICKNWKENTQSIYSHLMSLLGENNEHPIE